jgi:hypothetical protein
MLSQPVLQALAAHSRPASHALPQLPQFCASVVVSTHAAAQHCCGPLHIGEHTLFGSEPAEPPCETVPPAVPLSAPPALPELAVPAVPVAPPWSDANS